jgi:valyl-tRNA synthetase
MHYWIIARNAEEANEKAKQRFGDSHFKLEQDEDVLDTWFSSALFPFSSLGWPNEQAPDLNKFFPNSLLETGSDILFFWVSKMVMMSLALLDCVPFPQVFLHPLVRDVFGRKMSKLLGNVIDPIDVIEGISLEELQKQLELGNLPQEEIQKAREGQIKQFEEMNGIPQCGTDALRFTLLNYMSESTREIHLDVKRIFNNRTFCNKIYQTFKFAMIHLKDFQPQSFEQISDPIFEDLELSDRWILSRLNYCITECNNALQRFDFTRYTNMCYDFWMRELCDVYIELLKPRFKNLDPSSRNTAKHVLYTCIEQMLRLIHPAMPFISEELWQRLPGKDLTPNDMESIMLNRFPQARTDWKDDQAEAEMKLMIDAAYSVRLMKAQFKIGDHINPDVYISCDQEPILKELLDHSLYIQTLGHCGLLQKLEETPQGCASARINEHCTAYLSLSGHVNFDAEIERQRSKYHKLQNVYDKLCKKIETESYRLKVEQSIQEEDREKIAKIQGELKQLEQMISDLEQIRGNQY